jgi:hypothetical protein
MKKRRIPLPRPLTPEFAEKYTAIMKLLPFPEFDIEDIADVADDLRYQFRKAAAARSRARPAGRPAQAKSDYLCFWAAVEAQWRADRTADPSMRVAKSIEGKLKSLLRRGDGVWRIGFSHATGKYLEIRSVETGCKYHLRGARLVEKTNPTQRTRYDDIVARLMLANPGMKPPPK